MSAPTEKSTGKAPSFILCSETIHWRDKPHRFNTALLIDPAGTIINRYHKMHPVMFGEYVPLGGIFPGLYNLTPMAGGLTPGEEPKLFEVAGLRLAPSICFETTVPHLIRRQVIELRRQGRVPDALVNLTNDGWFWGSSELDLHLVCGVFRAVENRLPLLIAANTGFSAWIGAEGRVITRGPRRARDILVANLRRSADQPTAVLGSPYQHVGDLLAGACLLFCGLVVLSLVPRLLCRVVSGSSLHDS
jgi:apolipoprotein N-acyltransferase